MNTYKIFLLILLGLFLSCGKGTSSTEVVPTTGSQLNTDFTVTSLTCDGNYTGLYLAQYLARIDLTTAFPTCAQVKTVVPPTLSETRTLPSGFTLSASEGDVNVTSTSDQVYGVGYIYASNGTRGFMTNSLTKVKLTVPYKSGSVESQYANSTNLFIRILNYDDNSVVDIHGTITNGTIVAYIPGLPNQFFVAAIKNANMDATASTGAPSPDIGVAELDTATTWSSQRWCTVYNAASTRLKNAIQAIIGHSPTSGEIKTAVQSYVSNGASSAQYYYQTDGFMTPLLTASTSASDPCGSELSSNSRYNIVINEPSSSFSSSYPDDVITAAGNKYGMIYINPSRITTSTSGAGSTKASVAHNLFHAVANAYQLYDTTTLHGFREAIATLYAHTIDNAGTITVSSYDDYDTMLLSNFLNVNVYNATNYYVATSSEDFFAYVGKKYNSNRLNYLSTMMTQVLAEVQNVSTTESLLTQPARSTISTGQTNAIASSFSSTLANYYIDFMTQRLFEHNTESQFGRVGEVTSGFASDLLTIDASNDSFNSEAQVTVNPSSCVVSQGEGFGNVAPMATRVIKITPTAAGTARTITVKLTPVYGAVGQNWRGYTYYNSSGASIGSDTLTFSSFGTATTDEIDVAIAFTGLDRLASIQYAVTCQ